MLALFIRRRGGVRFKCEGQNDKGPVLYSGVMVVDSKGFFLSVCKPLQLTVQTPVENERA
jgi:hypothetical protein